MEKEQIEIIEEAGLSAEKKDKIAIVVFRRIYKKLGIILLLIAGLLVFAGGLRMGRFLAGSDITEEKIQITDTLLYQQLLQENELLTVKYLYTNMGKYENSIQLGNADIPFTKKSFIISYDGLIKAGIDLDKVEIEVDDKVIRITIPPAEILSHEIDEETIQVYDEKNSIFNGLSTQDVTNFQKQQKEEMEQKAIHNGILKEAKTNAEHSLRSLCSSFLVNGEYEEGYELEFIEKETDNTRNDE